MAAYYATPRRKTRAAEECIVVRDVLVVLPWLPAMANLTPLFKGPSFTYEKQASEVNSPCILGAVNLQAGDGFLGRMSPVARASAAAAVKATPRPTLLATKPAATDPAI